MIKIPSKTLEGGFEMPVFGIGTWEMGGGLERDPNNNDEADIQAIKIAIELGVAHIDTAELYAAGYAEILVGKAIKDYDRSKLFITTKVMPEHFGYEEILQACEGSLKRLGIPHIDLYLLHWHEKGVPLKETMAAMDELVERKKIKNIGVSNFSVERLKEAQSYSKNKIVCNQLHYNLIIREPERRSLLKFCQDNDIFLTAYRPIEQGKLAKSAPPISERSEETRFGERSEPVLIMKKLAQKYNKTPVQIALNWLILQKNVITIAKSRNIEHLKENLGCIGWNLDEEDIELLRKEYPGQKNVSYIGPLE